MNNKADVYPNEPFQLLQHAVMGTLQNITFLEPRIPGQNKTFWIGTDDTFCSEPGRFVPSQDVLFRARTFYPEPGRFIPSQDVLFRAGTFRSRWEFSVLTQKILKLTGVALSPPSSLDLIR